MNRAKYLLLIVPAMLAVHCGAPLAPPPHTLAQYDRMPRVGRESYPKRTILLSNLQRTLDTSLDTSHRVESCRLVLRLGADDPGVQQQLSGLLADASTPRELHQTVLGFLLEHNYPDLAAYAIPALYRADQDPDLRNSVLEWLTQNPSPQVLGEVVKLWAADPSASGPDEARYRQIVELISGRKWDTALLEGINKPTTFPRGAALELLLQRIPEATLRQRIMRMPPAAEAMAALQSVLEGFDYLPADRQEFAAVAALFKLRLEMFSEASRLAGRWRNEKGYRFNVRDFHLLSRLARDPLRKMPAASETADALARTLATRQHVAYSTRRRQRASVATDQFAAQAAGLTVADVWNLTLLNEMLSRPRMQVALKIIADSNRADTRSARSGLVFYQHGQAEAMLYPPSQQTDADGRGGVASERMIRDGRDAMSRFYVHFEKAYNATQVGPTAEELDDARRENYYGLILTSVDEGSFAAHYYNPAGKIVSLGRFPFRR